ncbi:MAG: ABC transporter ATP-binding protein [Oligoflexia bacterium]|nr:ABC transporter ATP-binding protein [Oligoflexia bacterium]
MAIVAEHVDKVLGSPPSRVLTDISLRVDDGEFVALTGRSGSGKSTLLYVLSSLDTPSAGSVSIDGMDVGRLSPTELSRLRNEQIGFVFQFHYLIAELTALENVLLPARRSGQERTRREYAESLLERVGLGRKLDRLPRQLSGGEQQRVAIARSLVMEPRYLFADEPTGALDSINGEAVMKMLEETNREKRTSIVLVTHEPDFAARAKRQIHLADGKIIE